MKDKIKSIIQIACKDLFDIEIDAVISRTDSKYGDYSTNVALQIAGLLKKTPIDIANEITQKIQNEIIEKVAVDGPGFINITFKDSFLTKAINIYDSWPQINKNKEILVEFGDPNPFKEMHLGHIYSSIVGDTISNLLQASGADVKRLSYHGDTGLPVAKWIWAIGNSINWDTSKLKDALSSSDDAVGYYYALGAKAYKDDEQSAEQVKAINEHVYKKDRDDINKIYNEGKKLSFDQFDIIFKEINVHYDKSYLESESGNFGLNIVKENIGKVFESSDGAIVYKGEKVGLHTRVFITSQGLPTYETKDLGLTELKDKDYPKTDRSIIITASEQIEYFKVMLAALNEINPELAKKTTHISHGFLSLTTGKMSSRTGDVYTARSLIKVVKDVINERFNDSNVKKEIFLSAVRYTFLKQKLGADIVFDVNESVSLEGNSGPYIQYSYARSRSILSKVAEIDWTLPNDISFEADERRLFSKITEYPEIVEKAINDCMPHNICTYLYELAQVFNSFYEKNRVIDNPRQSIRLKLVKEYSDVLKSGLNLLNIPAPEHM